MTLRKFPEYEELPEKVRVVYDEMKTACERYRKDTDHDVSHYCTISVQEPGETWNETDDQAVSLYTSVPSFLPDRERVSVLLAEMRALVQSNPRLSFGPFNGTATDGVREEIHVIYRLADFPEPEGEAASPLPTSFDFGFETV